MLVITEKAQIIANDVSGVTPTPVNITQIIQTITTIITDVLNSLQACGLTPTQAQAKMINPGIIEKLALRNSIRHHVSLFALRIPMFYSTLKVASTLSVSDVTSMMKEIA